MNTKNSTKNINFKADLKKLRALITRRDKIILLGLLVATIILSLIETIGISIIMPFITFASNPAAIHANEISATIYRALNFETTLNFMLFFTAALVLFYIFRAAYTIAYTYALNRFAYRKYHFFAYRLFCKSVELNYADFTRRNLDSIRANIVSEAQNASVYLQNFLQITSEIFTIILMYALLLLVSWKMTLVLTALLSIQVFFIMKFLNRRIAQQGGISVEMNHNFSKIISHTFGNFKIIKLKGNQKEIQKEFEGITSKMTDSRIIHQTLSALPRGILEMIGFSTLVGCVGYILFRYNDASFVIPIISMYALALYRILPALNRILGNISNMSFYSRSLNAVYDDLTYHTEAEDAAPIAFTRDIVLKNVSFSYGDSKNPTSDEDAHQDSVKNSAARPVLSDFNLVIKKGEKVGFSGPSGAGKSTLVDLIVGIYKPQKGQILVDGVALSNENLRAWRKKIGYIPQSIYLFDGSVAENVAFGSVMDEARVKEVCQKANILEFLETHQGIHTRVGDGGILLSGGQKQRIGIARALYDDPEILVLDEATSALDSDTEARIMDEIYSVAENKTLLVIAHRLSTLERCNKKVEL